MSIRKNEGQEYIRAFPKFKKWINECKVCHRQGYKPDMPDKITVVEGSYEVYFIKKYFEPLELNEDGICEQCAAMLKEIHKSADSQNDKK